MSITLLFVVLVVPGLLYLFYFSLRLYIFFRIVKHRHHHKKDSISQLKDSGLFHESVVKRMKEETFEVMVEKKIIIKGNFIKGKDDRLIIFSHGFQGTRWDMTKYADRFIEEGWNVVFFDFRTCGESGGRIGSLGGLEVKDLEAVVLWSLKRVENPSQFILFGESIGAAVSSVYSSTDKRVTAVIADSMYSSALKEVRSKLINTFLPKWFIERVLSDVIGWIRFYPGYEISAMNPEYSLMRTSIPLLLIHGDADMQVPPIMSWTIYKKRREIAPTQLYFCPNAAFSSSLQENPEKYYKIINSFLADDPRVKEFSRLYV